MGQFDIRNMLVYSTSTEGFTSCTGCIFTEYDREGFGRELFFEGPGAAMLYARARGIGYAPFRVPAKRVRAADFLELPTEAAGSNWEDRQGGEGGAMTSGFGQSDAVQEGKLLT